MPSNLLFAPTVSVAWTTTGGPSPAPAPKAVGTSPEAAVSAAPADVRAGVQGRRDALASKLVVHEDVDVRVELGLVLHCLDALEFDHGTGPLQTLDDGGLGLAHLPLVAEVLGVDVDLDNFIALSAIIMEIHFSG